MLCSNQLSYVATIYIGTACPEEARIFLNLMRQVKQVEYRVWV
jgi:hypothetical protein